MLKSIMIFQAVRHLKPMPCMALSVTDEIEQVLGRPHRPSTLAIEEGKAPTTKTNNVLCSPELALGKLEE